LFALRAARGEGRIRPLATIVSNAGPLDPACLIRNVDSERQIALVLASSNRRQHAAGTADKRAAARASWRSRIRLSNAQPLDEVLGGEKTHCGLRLRIAD